MSTIPGDSAVLRFARCTVDLERGVLRPAGDGAEVPLTRRERGLLRLLAAAAPRSLSRDHLHAEVWGSTAGANRACDTAIYRLRLKIEVDPGAPRHLLTAHGQGYQLVPLTESPATAPPAPVRARLAFGPVRVDLTGLRFERPDREGKLTAAEARILRTLADGDGRVVERGVLEAAVWGGVLREGRRMDRTIARLRAKVDPDGTFLATARGDGYQLLGAATTRFPPIPTEVDRRFGPEREVDDLVAEVRAHRLVALWGPGGIGKTRLAAAAARRLGDRVLWVASAPATTGDELAGLIATALGHADAASFTVGRAGAALHGSDVDVLVVDNVEQIPAVDASLRGWLDAAPNLRILATCRTVLGGCPIEVPPRSVADAVALFLDRCGRDDDPRDVEALVVELGGHPLAIELAASRTALTAATLRSRPPLQVLATRDLARVERHQSLRASLDASIALLPPDARDLLVRLPVFAGAFRADAVADVLGIGLADLEDRLDRLMDWALVTPSEQGRYALLPMVAEHAGAAADPAVRAADEASHGRFFARPLPADPEGPDEASVRLALDLDRADLRAAIERALARGDDAVALGALRSLRWVEVHATVAACAERLAETARDPAVAARASLIAASAWQRADDFRRGLPWLERARVLAGDPPAEVLVELQSAEVANERHRGDRDALRAASERYVVLAEAHGAPSHRVTAAASLARFHLHHQDPVGAMALLRGAAQVADTGGGPTCRATARYELGAGAMYAGDLETSLACLEEASRIAPSRADVHHARSMTLYRMGRMAEAAAAGAESMRLARRTAQRHPWAMGCLAEARARIRLGELDAAEDGFVQAAAAFRELGMRHAYANAVSTQAQVCFERGDLPGALRCVETVLEIGSDSLEVWGRSARAMLRARLHGEHASALVELERLEAAATGEVRALIGAWRAECLFDQGDPGSALICIEQVREDAAQVARHMLDPLEAVAARILARLGRVDEARSRLAGLARVGDKVARATFELADAEIALACGDATERSAALARAEALLPPESLGRRYLELRRAT